ncbi:MAG: ABC transporter ATP-binding protein [Clostridiales bacterium]|uniref:ABC transporter ATP-binding protein n=1 Tax=Clostridium sp. N3C TaxID=1776758 RepID=UPI00092DEC25|nr:ABC transporter ATP-binding protein [Clostridium sp. N3C]NLZ48012.1 ABC transporter ATP-binding protein [Clostridiales bacterium]SCN24857.1 putative ABC transporter ATP-binding protein YxlF [Clostridium sp. N3C]
MKLVLEDIKKNYGEKQVLKGASFTFEKGKIYGLLGRNGAGKTTLFNCISGELDQDSGSIKLIEEEKVYDEIDYSKVGYVFSHPVLPEFLTGYEFLKFYIDINKDKIKEPFTIEEYFNIIDIGEEDRHRLIKGYSHGMKNKMQMLCFLITRPPIILLDEPLTSFDVVVALEIKNLLKRIKNDHIIIFSTHILQLATDLCDEIVVLNNGMLEEIESDALKSSEFEEKIIEILKESQND